MSSKDAAGVGALPEAVRSEAPVTVWFSAIAGAVISSLPPASGLSTDLLTYGSLACAPLARTLRQ